MDEHYVYSYVDEERNIVYIGHGCKGRAWNCGYMKGDTEQRNDWKQAQIAKGRLPCDWVDILFKGLCKEDAKEIEKELIELHRPALNRIHNPEYKFGTLTEEVDDWVELRKKGLSYADIAKQTDYTTMTIWRALND